MDGFEVDTAALRAFSSSVDEISARVGALSGHADAAALPSGTFSQLLGGRGIEGVHTVVLSRLRAAVNSGAERLSSGARTALSSATEYDRIDSVWATSMTEIADTLDRLDQEGDR